MNHNPRLVIQPKQFLLALGTKRMAAALLLVPPVSTAPTMTKLRFLKFPNGNAMCFVSPKLVLWEKIIRIA